MNQKVENTAPEATSVARLADRIQQGERGIALPLGTASAVAQELRKRGNEVPRC